MLHWDGTKWSSLALPLSDRTFVRSMWGSKSSDVWAAGTEEERGITYGLILHWDGAQLKEIPSPHLTAYEVDLNDLAAITNRRNHSFAPRAQVDGVEHDTKQIRRNEAELRRPQSYDADDDAICRRQDPTLPTSSANQNRGKNRKDTRQAIKPQHEREEVRFHNDYFPVDSTKT